ncbi:MAG: hypothetical protein HYY14_06535 [Candidatus Omnitrophica bacterium]|nr:hypothetical protein [Candidatus Omnitrophota bacterium]
MSRAGVIKDAHVEAELVSEVKTAQAGHPFWVGLKLKVDDGWHIYWKDPGVSGMATRLIWDLPEGFEAGPVLWPKHQVIRTGDLTSYGYKGKVMLLTQIHPQEGILSDEESLVRLKARAEWLACKEECIPGKAELVLEVPVSVGPPVMDEKVRKLFEQTRRSEPAP